MTVPNYGLASTLTHGAGVAWPGAERDDVFVSIGSETAKAIVKDQIASRSAGEGARPGGAVWSKRGNERLEHAALFELFGKRAMLVIKDDAGGGLQKDTIFIRDLFEPPNENTAGFVEHLGFLAGGDQSP